MDLALLDWLIIIVFLGLFVWVGTRYKNKAEGGLANFFLGGRSLPWYIAGISMVATTFAADTPLAVTELVTKNGISGNWLWWSFLAGGMLTTFFFAKYWRRAEIITELELVSIRYSGKPAKFLRLFKSVYLGLFMNIMIIGWVNLAFISLLEVFFGFTTQVNLLITLMFMTIAVIYTSISGLLGVAITDVLQFVIAMTGCIILAILAVNSPEVGGITNLKNSLPPDYFSFFPNFSTDGNSLTLSIGAFFSFFVVQWWASWYPGSEPGGGGYVAQRMMSTKTEKDSVLATLLFQIAHYCIRPWPWIIVALCAVYLYGGYTQTDSLLNAQFTENPRLGYLFVMQNFLPVGLKGLLLVAFISAYLSTISTQLNWGASFLINDFYFVLKPKMTDSKLILASRIATVVLMVLGLLITSHLSSISGVWEFILECGAGLGLVLILRWYWWRINAWSEIVAMIAPFIGFIIGRIILTPLLGDTFTQNKGTFLFTVGFTTLSWLFATFITKPTNSIQLQNFYNKIKPDGWWPQNKKKFTTGWLFMAWISSVVLIYSSLFFIGKLILLFYYEAIFGFAVAIVSFIIMWYSLKKSTFF